MSPKSSRSKSPSLKLPGFPKPAPENGDHGLTIEIRALRSMMRQLLSTAEGQGESGQPVELEELISITGALGLAATRLASLLKTQRDLALDERRDLSASVAAALAEVVVELGLNK